MARDLNVLVTCGRVSPAVPLVRALHASGARVDVADPNKLAPALHSNAVDQIHVVAPPASEPVRFAEQVAEIADQRGIDLIVPAFEEVFALTRYADRLRVPVFAPPFEIIARLHNKARFVALCRDLGLTVPPTEIATNRAELHAAVARLDEFVARPAFSRGGWTYLTNHGPRAKERTIDDCEPTPENPWLVQPYLEGDDVCTFDVARAGKVLVHCTYEPTIPAPGGYALQFASVDDPAVLEAASAVCAEVGYTGLVGFDFRRTQEGLVMLECNPRVTAGNFLTPPDWITQAMLVEPPPREQRVVLAGQRRQYDSDLLNPHLNLPPRRLIHELLTTPDAFMSVHDVLPSLFVLISRHHWQSVARHEHIAVAEAFLGDLVWDGTPLPT
ncbi:MAG: ATP-grasp domain-containing protein [Pseudomonadota bacterium]